MKAALCLCGGVWFLVGFLIASRMPVLFSLVEGVWVFVCVRLRSALWWGVVLLVNFIFFVGLCWAFYGFCVEGLILAQDERWRRA